MVSTRKQEANRRNAQTSTGPRSQKGLARASRNALKHGLAATKTKPDFSSLIDDCVRDLGTEFQGGAELAYELFQITEAEIQLMQARHIRMMLLARLTETLKNEGAGDGVATVLDQISRADRYERRALSRRKFAIRDLVEAEGGAWTLRASLQARLL